MKFWNLEVGQAEDGSKVLDISIFGVIDPGFPFPGDTMSGEIAQQLVEHKDAAKINVRINSVGGDAFGGVAIYNLLREHPAAKAGNLTTTVEGLAASAASVVAMAGKTVMAKGSMMMIHNPWTIALGDAEAMRHQADVLDSVRESLVAIYESKTKMKRAELKKMLDAETWMTDEEAKRSGFADALGDAPMKARAEGDSIILNAVAFPRSSVPAPILAMASPPSPPKEEPMTEEQLKAKHPDVYAAVFSKGEKSGETKGAAAERARLQEIDDLDVKGCEALVRAAKYEQPSDAPTLAMAVVKAGKAAGLELLAAREREGQAAASVRQSAPEKKTEADEKEAAKNIAAIANRRRGGR